MAEIEKGSSRLEQKTESVGQNVADVLNAIGIATEFEGNTTFDDLDTKVAATEQGVSNLQIGDDQRYDQLRFDAMNTAELTISRLQLISKYGKLLKTEVFDKLIGEFLPIINTIEELASKGVIDDVDRQLLYMSVGRLKELSDNGTLEETKNNIFSNKKTMKLLKPFLDRVDAMELTNEDKREIFQITYAIDLIERCYTNYARSITKYFGLEESEVSGEELHDAFQPATGKKLDL